MAAEAVVRVLAINVWPRYCTTLALRLCSSICSPGKKKNRIALPVASALIVISSVGELVVRQPGSQPTQLRQRSQSVPSARALARPPLWLPLPSALWSLAPLFHAGVDLILPAHPFLPFRPRPCCSLAP